MHASEDGSGMACRRRSTRLHPQVLHASEEGAGVLRRRGSFPAALASPLENDDLLREILLRLPPQPSSLPRASAVCKQWLRAATDPKFLRRFGIHHGKPPHLGVFHQRNGDYIVFTPVLDAPDRISPRRFHLHLRQVDGRSRIMSLVKLLDCRNGRVLLIDQGSDEVIVWDPITGEKRFIAIPPEFELKHGVNGAVLCAAIDHAHVHESCHSSPFKVVLISYLGGDNQPITSVYSSETSVWCDIISTIIQFELFDDGIPGLLAGNALYWLPYSINDGILEFDLDEQSLAKIRGPPITNDFRHGSHWIIQGEDGAVGFAILSDPHLQMWQGNINCHGVATWVLWKTIDMRIILGLPPQIQGEKAGVRHILGCVEDTDGILLSVGLGVYIVQLKSMKSRKLCENSYYTTYHSFKSFYPPGTSIAGGFDGAEMMHDTQGNCLV